MAFHWPRTSRRGRAAMRAPETIKAGAPDQAKAATGFVALQMTGGAVWTGRDYAVLARHGYMTNPVVHACVRLIAQTAAAIPWLLYEGVTEHDEHPVLVMLDRPNPRQSGMAFMETLYLHLLMAGNAYVERVDSGRMAHLHLLRPDQVEVSSDADGWPDALVYRTGAASRRVALGTEGAPGLHVRLANPLDDIAGFAPLEAALTALDVHNAASAWNKALLDNSARPSGALVYAPKDGGNLTPEQFDRLRQELETGYSGAARAGRPLLLEGGLDWKAMALTPKDMDFIEARNGAARDIALTFGVPPMLLGIPGDNTYANYREANRAFYRLTVVPLVTRLASEFSHWLAPLHGGRIRLAFDADRVDGLSGDRDALWERLDAATFLTVDEKREAAGYQPMGGTGRTGDV
ncbi:phage portal protein [Zhengella mangrovi]|uniref:Phage portal protein n=1 Tax=Zhengella mangrovi TaxID=1982044 RepID=A0A2G1QSC6_9HYPH|nr:phage portal protein [Zhengella mangrovi]PHP68433.1 phage portal protein [Zhengella mangrovi]